MFNVKSRSIESWGVLADYDDKTFNDLINQRKANSTIKEHLKLKKKLKTYTVSFKKEWYSDEVKLQAENEWSLTAVAKQYFKENKDKIEFKERERSQWAGEYKGYDSITYRRI